MKNLNNIYTYHAPKETSRSVTRTYAKRRVN